MIATVLADVLGVSSASIAQHSPAHAIAVPSGQCTSPSGTCSRRPIRPPILALSLRSLRQYARPAVNCDVAASASRAAVTARKWASLDNPGAAARYGSPQAARPARVSQTQRGPGLSTAASAFPAARQRVTAAAVRLGVTASRAANWSSCTPYIEWAVAGIFGVPVKLAWIEQPAAPGSVRTELDWQGRPGLSGEIASALAAWNLLRFEVTEEASAGCDAVRYSCTPALGMFTASMGANGDIMISENRLRAALTLAASGADSDRLGAIRELHGPRHPALGGSLEAELSLLLGDAWDAELEPFRHASAGAPVRWLHATG